MRIIEVRKLALAMCGALVVATAACSSTTPTATTKSDAGEAGAALTRTDSCASTGFRDTKRNDIVCPGTSTCSCSGGQVCCMRAIDVNTGACTDLSACRYIAFTCDGPEDCGGATAADGGAAPVCCLDQGSGGGSLCRATPTACPSHKILCHSDDDCIGVAGLPYCRPADFGTQGVEDRGLDGLIGICSQT